MKTVMKMFYFPFSGQTISQADLITAILTNNPAVRINSVQQFFVASFKVLRFFTPKTVNGVIVNRSVLEWIEHLFLKRETRFRFPVGSNRRL